MRSDLAAEVLGEAEKLRQNDLVFLSATGRRMTDNTLSKLLRDLGIDAVPHGFRSSFRDWCGESGQSRELAEAALAHTIRNKAEAAYSRTDLLERRRELMEAWSEYVVGTGTTRRQHRESPARLMGNELDLGSRYWGLRVRVRRLGEWHDDCWCVQ